MLHTTRSTLSTDSAASSDLRGLDSASSSPQPSSAVDSAASALSPSVQPPASASCPLLSARAVTPRAAPREADSSPLRSASPLPVTSPSSSPLPDYPQPPSATSAVGDRGRERAGDTDECEDEDEDAGSRARRASHVSLVLGGREIGVLSMAQVKLLLDGHSGHSKQQLQHAHNHTRAVNTGAKWHRGRARSDDDDGDGGAAGARRPQGSVDDGGEAFDRQRRNRRPSQRLSVHTRREAQSLQRGSAHAAGVH